MKHESKEIIIKKAEVDNFLIPIVEWLNSHKDIHTRFCCECEPPEGPFIIFYCELIFPNKEMASVFVDHINEVWEPEPTDKMSIVETNGIKYPKPLAK